MTDTGPASPKSLDETWEQQYWNSRYNSGQTSGYGSYGEQLDRKLKLLEAIPVGSVKTVLDIGCGDFNMGKNVMFQLKLDMEDYMGYDISETIITRNKGFYPRSTFKLMKPGDFPDESADLLMCTDVLLHIIKDEDADKFVDNLYKLWTTGSFKYLVVTAYEKPDPAIAGHVRVRIFDYKRFGEPIAKGIVEDEGESTMYIYAK